MPAPRNDKSGSTAATPFSTAQGTIPAGGSKTIEKGTDFSKDARGQGIVAGGRDFGKDSRPQPTTPETPGKGTPGFRPERAQQPGSPEERQAKQIPATGIHTLADPGVASRSIGAADPNRAPFRVSTPTVKAKR